LAWNIVNFDEKMKACLATVHEKVYLTFHWDLLDVSQLKPFEPVMHTYK